MEKAPTLKPKKIKGRIKVLKAIPYKGHMMYVRMIGTDLFEWLVVFNNQIYSSYMVITPDKTKNKLTKKEVMQAAGILWAGAEATIDTLLEEKLDLEAKEIAERVVN